MSGAAKWHFVTTGDKQNPPLLFLHGFMGAASDWQDITASLADTHYCLCVDLPGHGKTEVASEKDYTMERCAANLIAMLDEMEIGKCGLVGYSMGGRLAFFLAVNYPERFDKIVIESGSPGLKTESERKQRIEQDTLLAQKLSSMSLAAFLKQWYDQPLFDTFDKSGPAFEKLIKARAQNKPARLARSLTMMGVGAQPSLWPRLGEIQAQLLLIVGERDRKFNQITTDVTGQCPTADVAVVNSAGHNVHFENTEEYIKQVRLFFQT